jgi:hypothetical protein
MASKYLFVAVATESPKILILELCQSGPGHFILVNYFGHIHYLCQIAGIEDKINKAYFSFFIHIYQFAG